MKVRAIYFIKVAYVKHETTLPHAKWKFSKFDILSQSAIFSVNICERRLGNHFKKMSNPLSSWCPHRGWGPSIRLRTDRNGLKRLCIDNIWPATRKIWIDKWIYRDENLFPRVRIDIPRLSNESKSVKLSKIFEVIIPCLRIIFIVVIKMILKHNGRVCLSVTLQASTKKNVGYEKTASNAWTRKHICECCKLLHKSLLRTSSATNTT